MDARALVLDAPRRLVPRDLPQPQQHDDDGMLRIEACGLCGTDHEQFTGVLSTGPSSAHVVRNRHAEWVFPVETVGWGAVVDFCNQLGLLPEERSA